MRNSNRLTLVGMIVTPVVAAVAILLIYQRPSLAQPSGGHTASPALEPGFAPLYADPRIAPVPPVEVKTDRASPVPLHKLSPYPPGTYIPVTHLPKLDHGIPMGDGTFLPLLNGMTWAPPIFRDSGLGPPGPVIAKVVDQGGFEWWLHADGSSTTSRYKQISVRQPDGSMHTYWDPASEHTAKKPDSQVIAVDPAGHAK